MTWVPLRMSAFVDENVQLALAVLGGIVAVRIVYSVAAFLFSTFLSGGVNVKKLGSWAVVTASSLRGRA